MADNDIESYQPDEGMKADELHQDINKDENDSKDTEINAAANNEDAHMVEEPKKEPGLETEVPTDNPPTITQDRGDCQNMETQEEPTINIRSEEKADTSIYEEADGSQVMKSNEESADGSMVTTEKTTETPAPDDEETSKSKPILQEPPALEETVSEEVETIGPQADSTHVSDVSVIAGDNNSRKLWIWIALLVAAVAVVAALSPQLLQPESPLQKKDVNPIDIFRQEMEKVKVKFPSQREELWKRSGIHLQRHFLITQPSEPVSLILTAGVRAEATLRCLAQSMASALSSALNASVLHLEGASKSSQDSDLVKSDIDSQLQKAFEGGKPIAVIHRFEELPPASTLIFYRYCDHENAAFKKTFLIFTVLLGEEDEIQAKTRLSEVEEMVTDHLQKKFLSHGHPTAFDKMDIDKYGGLWSRISHLILPVSTEQRIEKTGYC